LGLTRFKSSLQSHSDSVVPLDPPHTSAAMAGSLLVHASFVMALVLTGASRDEDSKTVEFASGGHFVDKNTASHASLKDVTTHQEHKSEDFPADSIARSPEMQQQMSSFTKDAETALNTAMDKSMEKSDRDKKVNEALTSAARTLSTMTSMVDVNKDPELSKLLEDKLQTLTQIVKADNEQTTKLTAAKPAALMQTNQEASPASSMKITPEMQAKVKAFSQAALQAIANGKNPDMSNQDKQTAVQSALAHAAKAMSSIATMADPDNSPALARGLANLRDLTDAPPSLIEQHMESIPAKGSEHDSHYYKWVAATKAILYHQVKATPAIQQKVAALSKGTEQALAHMKDPDMSPFEQANHVQKALAQAKDAMSAISGLADAQEVSELQMQADSSERANMQL